MISEIKAGIKDLEESRKEVNYALDMLEEGLAVSVCPDITRELELLALFNRKIADYVLNLVDLQDNLNVSLESLLEVELKLNKVDVEDAEIPF